MCMKYVNVNVQCFDGRKIGFWDNVGFSDLISSVKANESGNGFVISGFNIVTFINARGTKNGKDKNNPVDMRKKLLFRIRLTKVDKAETKQLSYDLGDFTLDLNDNKLRKTACFDYVEQIHVLEVKETLLESKGQYVIKVLIKEAQSELFDIQITHPLYVK